MTLGIATVMLITGSNAVFAYSESTEEHTYAGSTRMDCYLEMDNFSAKASLETSDDSELYWGMNYLTDIHSRQEMNGDEKFQVAEKLHF